MKRWIAGIIAALTGLNGAAMLADGRGWYARTPGVVDTGPFNPHFVADIGAAFLAASLGLAACAWRARYWPAALAGAAFLAFHALIHIVGVAMGHSHTVAFELGLVVLPAALALYAALPAKGET
jgi:hypothetical protein